MNGTVEREIARIAAERLGSRAAGLVPDISRVRLGRETLEILKLDHPMLVGTAYANPGMPDAVGDEQLTAHGRRCVQDAVDDIARRIAREETRVRIEHAADVGRPWLEDRDPPSWTLISHPLMVHALMRAESNDLPVVPSAAFSTGVDGVSIRRLQDLLVGSCPLDRARPARGRVFCDDMGLVMEIADDIPHVARAALIGHPIGALVELPACGDPSLDAAVEELFIAEISGTTFEGQAGIAVSLSAATWIPCAPAPPRVNDHAMRLPHKTC